jgi:uncharacterized protein (UPF0335 family)
LIIIPIWAPFANVLKVDVNLQKLVLKIEHLEEENSKIESKCRIVKTKSKSAKSI